jgi:Ca-activated chloride channel family protein
VELEYSQVLPVENGVVRYVYPLNTEKFSARPLEDVRVRVDIRSPDAMRAVYSPTHQDRVFIERPGDYQATLSYEETDVLPREDFEVIYTVSQEEVGLNLLTYRQAPDDGFFLLLVAPPVTVDEAQVVPRDVLLVLDTSGSMEGEKIEQAQGALAYVLEHLNPQDRFNVIAFSSGLRQYAARPQPVEETGDAIAWVEHLEALGGTDINRALLEALAQVDPQRPTVLIFLTDGLPTEGVTDVDRILSHVGDAAPENVRLFPFGVGDDVNTLLLDALADQHRGAPGYVRPHERIDEEISAFYAIISQPVLTDLALDFGGIVAEDDYPHPLPDLFAGRQLILAGRYRGTGPTTITLSGTVNGEQRRLVYEGLFRAEGGDNFIPRLWATRKIGHLLTQIRLHGEREEWVEAIVALSVRYGVVTPYTSFLIDEQDILTAAGQEAAAEKLRTRPTAPAVGAPAVEMAEDEAQLRAAESGGGMMPVEAREVVRVVGSKTFVLQEGVWVDTTFEPERMDPRPVQFGAPDYFELLAARPAWGPYMALGERVIFVAEGTAYEITTQEAPPLELPAVTATPEPASPATEAPAPTATLAPVVDDAPAPRRTGGGPCAGALALGALTLGAVVAWERMNALRLP